MSKEITDTELTTLLDNFNADSIDEGTRIRAERVEEIWRICVENGSLEYSNIGELNRIASVFHFSNSAEVYVALGKLEKQARDVG